MKKSLHYKQKRMLTIIINNDVLLTYIRINTVWQTDAGLHTFIYSILREESYNDKYPIQIYWLNDIRENYLKYNKMKFGNKKNITIHNKTNNKPIRNTPIRIKPLEYKSIQCIYTTYIYSDKKTNKSIT